VNTNRAGKNSVRLYVISALIVAALAAVATTVWAVRRGGTDLAAEAAVFVVKPGPLTISVIESGTTQNREKIVVKCRVEGRSTIIWMIEEGQHVEKGAKLMELDSSKLVEKRDQQEITVTNAEASFMRAEENFAVAKNQAQSDIDKAELALRFAKLDLEKYLGKKGEYAQQLQQADTAIKIAEEQYQRAKEKRDGSIRLREKNFITETELKADEFALTRAELDRDLAQSKMDLLKTYTHQRALAQFQSDVKQAEMALERTRRKAKADVLQARVDMQAKGSQYERQKAQLKKIKLQIANCIITSPVAGQAVYATTGGGHRRRTQEPLSEGQDVRERQELFHIPTADGMMAQIKIHESSLQKVQAGMAVRVTVSAVPGKVFTGRVAKIAPLPDPQSFWMNPDLKVFNTEIHLDGENGDLRPGMSCRAEIIVEEHARATFVPIQTVQQINGTATVFVRTDDGVKQRAVKLGLDNNRMAHVLEGLAEGDQVLLAPPLIAPVVEQKQAPAATTRKAAVRTASKRRPAGQARPQPTAGPKAAASADPQQMRNMTREQRRKMWEKLTPEQRKAFQERRASRRRERGERRGRRGGRERGERPAGQDRP